MDIYPNNLDQSLNDTAAHKLRKYRGDYNFNPTRGVSFIPTITSTCGRLHSEFIRILFSQTHRETDPCFTGCDGVFYRIVSFLIPNPQHTVSLYTFIYQESAWSGRSGLAISRTQRNILRYSSSGMSDTGIVPDTGVTCHDSP